MANVLVKIAGDITELDRATRQAVSKIQGMARDMENVGRTMTAALTLPIVGLGVASLKSFGEIDSLKKALGSLEGSVQGAEGRFKELQEVAKLPGLGIREVVQADLTLRNFGRTAAQSKVEVLAFGNALAAAGRGKADLSETIRQFGQLTSAAKLTQENLTPIIERVPQVAGILRKEFGPTGGTAEGLRNLGVTTQQAAAVIIKGLQTIPPVAGGFKNAMENTSESVQIALAEIGSALAPMATRISDQFVTPSIEKIKQLAQQFKELDQQTQGVILAVAAIAAAAGPVIIVLASLISSCTVIAGAFVRIGGAARAGATAMLTALASTERVTIGMGLMSGSVSVATSMLVSLAATMGMVAIAGASVYWAVTRITEAWRIDAFVRNAFVNQTASIEALEKRLVSAGISVEALKAKYRFAIEAMNSAKLRGVDVLDEHTAKMLSEYSRELFNLAKGHVSAGAKAEENEKRQKSFGEQLEILGGHHKALSFESKSLANSLMMMVQSLRVQEYERAKMALAELIFKIEKAGGPAAYMAKTFTDLVAGSDHLNDSLGASKPLWDVIPDRAETMGYALEQIAKSMAAEAIARVSAAARQFKAEADFMARIAKDGQKLAAENQRWFDANTKNLAREAERASAEMSRHIERHWHQIANAITKAGFSAKNAAKAFADMGRELLRSIASAALEAQLGRLTTHILKLTNSSTALGKVLGAVFNPGKDGPAPTSTQTPGFNPGAAITTATQAAGAAGQISSAGGNAAAGATSSAGSGLVGIIGAGAAVAGAVSSIVGNFQFAHMNTALGRIEESTRYAKSYLLQLVNEAQLWWPRLNDIHNRMKQMVDTGVGVYNQPGDQGIRLAGAGAGGTSFAFNNCTFGGDLTQSAVDGFMRSAVERLRLGGQLR